MMSKSLEYIVFIRNSVTNVTLESFGFKGTISKISPKLAAILPKAKSLIREAYYTSDNSDVEYDKIRSGEEFCLSVDTGLVKNYFELFSDFISGNKYKCPYSEFYIHDLNYHEGKTPVNLVIERYQTHIELVNLLWAVSDYQKEIGTDLELFFYKAEQGIAFLIEFTQDDLLQLDTLSSIIKELQAQFTNKPDAKERKQIFVNELINSLTQKEYSYRVLLNEFSNIKINYEKSFALYLAGFSFDKVRTASTEYFHELTDRIHTTLLKFSTYIFAIPVGYILLLRFLDFSGESFLKDTFLVGLGLIFFILIWFVSFSSIKEGIVAIQKDILSFRDKLGNDKSLRPIKEELDSQYNTVIPNQKKKLNLVKLLSALILTTLISAYIIIYFEEFKTFKASLFKTETSTSLDSDIPDNSLGDKPSIIESDSLQNDSVIAESH